MKHLIYIFFAALLATGCSTQPDFDAQGTFEATEILVSAQGSGQILRLDVEQGDTVAAEQPLGLIDTLQLSLQRRELLSQRDALLRSRPDIEAQTASLKEQIAGTTTDRNRILRLLAEGAATQQQLDNLNTRLASLQGELEGRKSMLGNNLASINEQAQATALKIETLDNQIANCIISSPISGTVLTKIAEPGEVTAFGKPLFKIADMHDMFLRAYFTSSQLANLKLGDKVRVMADYGDNNFREYDGTISFISSQSEFTPKTIQTQDSRANLVYAVKIAVKNDGFLKIGLTGNVYVGN